MGYYAHTTNNLDKSDWQTVKEHLVETAILSEKFAEKFNQKNLGYLAGLYHDLGKYSEKFQKRLEGDSSRVDHSTAGAKKVFEKFNTIGKIILAYSIAGHHSGLLDTNGLEDRLNSKIEDYSAYKDDLSEISDKTSALIQEIKPLIKQDDIKASGFSLSFLTRMIYSCLVDADWLNTEEFCQKSDGTYEENGKLRSNFDELATLDKRLEEYLQRFENSKGKINEKRREILHQCLSKAKNPKGLYSLTVPTGGGKTLSSLGFALKHAITNNQDRIIYTIPYTSIIEQNAGIFRGIFGDENVLEHHSNFVFEDKDDENEIRKNQKLKYATENWDIPIIATTNVQFFESLFSHKKSRCRKLHNIANSVIVMDEAQMIPINYLIPCVRAVEELVKYYNCTFVLCTATQPSLDDKFTDIKPVEIISNTQDLFDFFKRVEVDNIGKRSDDELIEEISGLDQVLTIVNSKKHAKELYSRLKSSDGVFHLSTLMCPIHRKETIKKIKKRLKENLPTKVISTQLIEAGVDIDFPYVYRSSAGLDSIAQSAGRCNREGKLDQGTVRVFQAPEYKIRGYLSRTAEVGSIIVEKFKDVLSTQAVKEYFNHLYFFEGKEQLDKKNIMDKFKLTSSGEEIFEFEKASKKFNFIEEPTTSIIILFDDKAQEILEKIKYTDYPKKYLKQLQPYTVNLRESDFKALQDKGFIENINNIVLVLNDMSRYDSTEGLIIDKNSEALFC